MNQTQYLEEIRRAFSFLPPDEQDEMVRDYAEHFAEGMAQGRSEESIIEALGHPSQLARQSKAALRIQQAQDNTTPGNLLRAVLATVALGFLNVIVVLGPFVALCVLILLGFLAGILFTAAGAALTLGAFPLLGGYFGLTAFVSGVALAALGILIFCLNVLVARWFGRMTIRYLQKNIAIIKGA